MAESKMFSDEEIKNCICSQDELDEAVLCGEKVETESIDGKVIAYIYGGKTYVVAVELK